MGRKRTEQGPPIHRGVRLEPVTNIRATRGFNVGKGVASTSISITADVPPATADLALELAAEGTPLFLTLGTNQAGLFQGSGTPPAEDPPAEEAVAGGQPEGGD